MPANTPLSNSVFITTPETMGAVGNGVKDDSAAINALSLAISRNGGGIISFDPAKRYYIARSIVVYPSVSLQGNGATLQTDQTIYCVMVPNPSFDGIAYEISYTALRSRNPQKILAMASVTSKPTAATNVLSISHSIGFSVGDTVCIRLGQNPTDPPEARIILIATVTDISEDTLTIDRPIPVDTTLTGVNIQNAMVYKYKYNVDGISISGFNFECLRGADIEGGILLEWCRNIRLADLTANRFGGLNMGNGIVTAVRTQGIRGKNLHAFQNANTTGQTSKGRLIGIGSSIDCLFEGLVADQCQSWIACIEGYSQGVTLKDVTYNDVSASSSVKTLLLALQGSEYVVDDLKINSNSTIAIDDNGGTYAFGTIKDVTVKTVLEKFPVAGPTASYKGLYKFSDGANSFALDFDNLQVHEMKMPLKADMDTYFAMQRGVVVDLSAYASPDCLGITALYKGTADNGADRTFLISPGHWESEVFHAGFALLGFNPYYTYEDTVTPTKILLKTAAKVAGFLSLRISIAPFLAGGHQ